MKKTLIFACILVLISLTTSARADIRNCWNPSKIHNAVKSRDAIAVVILINQDPKCLNSQQWNRGLTPLMMAAECPRRATVSMKIPGAPLGNGPRNSPTSASVMPGFGRMISTRSSPMIQTSLIPRIVDKKPV